MAIEVGSKLEGKVTGITHFGAFVELPEGGTGLVHISEIADNYVKDVNDHLKLSDVVTVKVINVDKDGKIGLSIKQAVDKPLKRQDLNATNDQLVVPVAAVWVAAAEVVEAIVAVAAAEAAVDLEAVEAIVEAVEVNLQ